MKRKVIKTGNSLAVTIPAEFIKALGVKVGDEAEFVVSEQHSKMTVKFLRKPKQIALFNNRKKKK